MQKDRIYTFLFISVLCLLAAGIVNLFFLRFESGDIYPPYSTLRSDPIGTRGIHDALSQLNTVNVSRHFSPVGKIKGNDHTTLFILGVHPERDDAVFSDTFDGMTDFLDKGGRLVLTFTHIDQTIYTKEQEDEKQEENTFSPCEENTAIPEKATEDDHSDMVSEDDVKNEENNIEEAPKTVLLSHEWEFDMGTLKNETEENEILLSVPPPPFSEALNPLIWYSPQVFHSLSEAWETVYTFHGQPVMVKRQTGNGTLILASDTYFLSNEALRDEPNLPSLVFLIGQNDTIIFDESHLGINHHPGIMFLVRKYRLHGVLAVLFIFSLLMIWKNAAVFIPVPEEEEVLSISSRDISAGFVSLLRKNIAQKDILNTCVNVWGKSFISENKASTVYTSIFKEMKQVAEEAHHKKKGTGNNIIAYDKMATILSEGKKQ